MVVQYTDGYFENGAWHWGKYCSPVNCKHDLPFISVMPIDSTNKIDAWPKMVITDTGVYELLDRDMRSNVDERYDVIHSESNHSFDIEYLPATLIGGLVGGVIGFILVIMFLGFI